MNLELNHPDESVFDENKISHISIIGSCIPRDVFEICRDADGYIKDSENLYVVDRFVQSIGLISAVSPCLDKTIAQTLINESHESDASGFYKRNFMLDVTKTWSDYLNEVKSEWLIIDVSTARFRMIEFEDSYITESLELCITSKLDEISEDSLLYKLKESKKFDALDLDREFLKEHYFKYFDKLLSIYPQDKIIVLGVKHGFSFVDDKNSKISLLEYNTECRQKRENEIIEFAYSCAKEYMPDAHFIDGLPIEICDVQHKWGMLGLHYVPDTYLYYFRCIDFIIHSCSGKSEEKEFISNMQFDFSRKIFQKFSSVVNKITEKERNELCLEKGVVPGEYEKNGVKLIVSDDYSYSVCGTAIEDVVFYLFSSHRNPLGEWVSLKQKTESGVYKFMTGTKCIGEDFFVQLVLANDPHDRKWVKSFGWPAKVILDKSYDYQLVRMVVKKGTSVNASGKLFLEKND